MTEYGRACPYCRSPAWRNPCWWRLLHPNEAIRNVNADPPCVCDDAAAAQAARDRRFWRRELTLIAAVIGAVALAIYLLGKI